MTAYGELDMIQGKLGALTHFAKPFDINDIREASASISPRQNRSKNKFCLIVGKRLQSVSEKLERAVLLSEKVGGVNREA